MCGRISHGFHIKGRGSIIRRIYRGSRRFSSITLKGENRISYIGKDVVIKILCIVQKGLVDAMDEFASATFLIMRTRCVAGTGLTRRF